MDDNYASLKQKLEENVEWPSVYLFKFIIPADNIKLAELQSLFDSTEAQITTRSSKNGNFVSVSAKEMMINAERVIDRYKQAAKIEGIISLWYYPTKYLGFVMPHFASL